MSETENEIRIVLCTFPDAETARQIGTALVEKQLAACVNIVPAVESIYRWQGAIEITAEVLAIFKTTATVYPAFEKQLTALHPYEVPEIIALHPASLATPYANWVTQQTTVPTPPG
jgi:periplasmic divalent cation tolerance protein